MNIFKNGVDWTTDELAMLIMYKDVKIEHLAILLSNHVIFDIERKKSELVELNITDLAKLSEVVGTEVKWG